MTRVFWFSGTGHSRAVAEYIAGRLGAESERITGKDVIPAEYSVAVIVFPVYCQNVPGPVRAFLHTVSAEYAAVIATYGGFSPGNVLRDAEKLLSCPLTAAACLPTGHSLLGEDGGFDKGALDRVIEKIKAPSTIKVPRMKKAFWADIAPGLRSRIGTKIIKSASCVGCGKCRAICPAGGDSKRCIRCLRCVAECHNGALTVKNGYFLRKYLGGKRKAEIVVIV